MSAPTAPNMAVLALVDSDGRPNQTFRTQWNRLSRLHPLPPSVRVVDAERKPTREFVSLWRQTWGPGGAKALQPAMVLFQPDGRFTPLGLARWVAVTR